ncbi:hypothetical protein BGZ93_005566 [Podila epicladia]|nr:hypothetical protein BGZ92_005482 [Podila epicladia]KAG0095690.1 hypothetical protein BGZ93_005566 [Podila epicladia]
MLNTSSVTTATSVVPLPVLEDYDVSSKTGFVPTHGPLARLPQDYFEPWEQILDQLNPLLDSKQLRIHVDKLPLLDVSRLESRRERQRAYSLLSILAHSYVWGQGLEIAQSIPEPLAVPWQTISDILDIPPVLTYASSDLWNWKVKDPRGSYDIDNLAAIHCMTGTSDEDWFVIVSIAVEIEGGAALQPLLDAMHAVRRNDPEVVLVKLKEALPQLEKVGKLLGRMFERCDPAVFYWKIRKFLAGSENSAGLGLPNGLQFKGVNNERKYHMGATAGQSSLFPALDVILGIEHFEKSDGDVKRKNILLAKMKNYMPAPHRAFLDHLAKVANLRPFILEFASENTPMAHELTSVYDGCLHQIKLFRDVHIQIVTRYIMTQAKRGPPEGWEDYRVQVGVNKDDEKKKAEKLLKEKTQSSGTKVDDDEPVIKGTGGSDLMPFLKQNRDETNAAKVQTAK